MARTGRPAWGARFALAAVAVLGAGGWSAFRLWPRALALRPAPSIPVCERIDGRDVVTLPGRHLIASVGEHDDEFYAYLLTQYLRGAGELQGQEVMLTHHTVDGRLQYTIRVRLQSDLIASLATLEQARRSGLIAGYDWRFAGEDTLRSYRYQSHVFATAYNLAAPRGIGEIGRPELAGYLARFMQFKSAVDPRIRRKIEPVPQPLTRNEATRLAADIVAVTEFYSLPLAPFVGIGAMENNYMNVRGDLGHTVWKRRADRGDVVLARGRRGVRVLNSSLGVWQITRETLRAVHRLYLADGRDYSTLPEHLRPPAELDLDNPAPEVLTTYAGLLFRHLIDRFEGDVPMAVGAYNGGPGNPNLRYETGVRRAAEHASSAVSQAAALQGRLAAGMLFLRPGR